MPAYDPLNPFSDGWTAPRVYTNPVYYADDVGVSLRPEGYGRKPKVQTMVWGGSTGHGYSSVGSNGVFTLNDATDYALGTVAVKAVTTGTGLQTVIGQFSGSAMDMTGQIPIVWLKVEGQANMLTFKFWLGSGGLANAYTWDLKENALAYPWIADGQWVAITLPLGTATISGTPVRNAMTDMELQIYDNSGGQVTVHFGGLGFVPEPSAWPNGVVSFTFDDGIASQYSTARPKLDQYGFRATAYLITETLWNPTAYFPNYFTLAQARSLEDTNGWEMGTHSFTAAAHNAGFATLTAAQQQSEMLNARNYLSNQGFNAPMHFSYPLGVWNDPIRANVKRSFYTGRTLNTVGDESLPPADASKLRVFNIANTTTLGAMQAAVDRAYASKQWLIFAMHDVVTTPTTGIQMSTANFNSIVDYVKTKGIPVRLVSEVMSTIA